MNGPINVLPVRYPKFKLISEPPLEKIAIPQHRFDHIHVDVVGLLPPSDGYTYLLTVVNRFSR